MYYGWVISPVEYVDTSPDLLRIDYRSDYVLMVAEAYHSEDNLEVVVRRLAVLGDVPPEETVAKAILFGVENGYAESDIALMQKLANDLQTWNPSLEIPIP